MSASNCLRRCLVLALAAVAQATPRVVRADAVYSGMATFTMRPQDAIVNTFGFGGPIFTFFTPPVVVVGNAAASNFAPIGLVRISGETHLANGFAQSVAAETETYTLGNLTGSGGPTGPGRDLLITINYSFSYDLVTMIDNPAEDAALEHLLISVVASNGFTLVLVDQPIGPNTDHKPGSSAPNSSFTLTLPANSVTNLTATFSLAGAAQTVSPPPAVPPNPQLPATTPTPEPATVTLTGLGLLGLAVVGRRRRV